MKPPSSVPSWCRCALVVLSLLALTSCATAQQNSLSGAEKPICDRGKGICTFAWEVYLISKPDAAESEGEHFASGSSVYPVNTFTDVPVEINGDQNRFFLVFNIGSADISTFSFVTLSGEIHRGKSGTATFSQKISIRSGGTGKVRVRVGDETFIISVTAPTFTPHTP